MNKGSSGIYDRCLEKTPEQLFIGVLRREFELSPAASLGILETAKEHLFSPVPETAGKLRFVCDSGQRLHETCVILYYLSDFQPSQSVADVREFWPPEGVIIVPDARYDFFGFHIG